VTTLDEADKKARLERARETGPVPLLALVQELTEAGLPAAERAWRLRWLPGWSPARTSRPGHGSPGAGRARRRLRLRTPMSIQRPLIILPEYERRNVGVR
jgi:hypothetical protein